MIVNFSELSKIVGWEPRTLKYPSMRELWKLEKALRKGKDLAMAHVLEYQRFLPSPLTQEQMNISSILSGLFEYMKQELLQDTI